MHALAFSRQHPAPATDSVPDARGGSIPGEKPTIADYGYVVGAAATACTHDELLAHCTSGAAPDRVWTPESDGPVVPYDVPWIFDALMLPARKRADEQVRTTAFLLGLFAALGALALASGGLRALSSGPPPLLVLFGVFFAQAVMERRRVRAVTPAILAAQVAELRALPAARAGEPRFTWTLAAAIAAVALVQLVAPGSSIAGAGLVKDAVRHGEGWRLLTAPLMHGGATHLLMNGMALLAVGPEVERLSHRAYLPLVFLAAALAGGAGSMLLYPHTTSVGASGGLMGVIGFLVVLAHRRRELLPSDMGRRLLMDVGWIALLGVVGYAFIDNGAHAGGLLGGAALGLLLVPRGGVTPHWEPSAAVRAAGWASLAVIAVAVLTAAIAMFAYLRV
jgi:membrane associated rhomboid family serine protease